MTAFDEILAYSSKAKLNEYRQTLVAHKRGTLSSGSFAASLSIQYPPKSDQVGLISESEFTEGKTPQKLFMKFSKTSYPGLIFDENGTNRAISNISSGGSLKLLDEFGNFLKFGQQQDKDNWLAADRTARRRCLARNVEDLIKKTDINYRTHGDRLHYLVVGLVTIKIGAEKLKYPLFLFACNELSKNQLEAEIEATGFLNFWLDKNYLENNLMAHVGGYEVNMNESFPSLLNTLTSKINSLQFGEVEEINVDPTYSALAIVTGFEAEYIDPVWEKLVK